MAEEGTKDTGRPDEGGDPTTPAKEVEKTYSQVDVDNITAKVRGGLEAKLTKAQKELEDLRQKAMSDDERKIAEAKAEAVKEYQGKLAAVERASAIKLELAARGIGREHIDRVVRLVGDEEDPSEAVNVLVKEMPQLFQNKARTVGGAAGPNQELSEGPAYTADYVTEMIGKKGPGWYAEHKKEIEKWQAENVPTPFRQM